MIIPSQESFLKPCNSNITLPAAYLTEIRDEVEKQGSNFENQILGLELANDIRESRLNKCEKNRNFIYKLSDDAVDSKKYSNRNGKYTRKLNFQEVGTIDTLTDITGHHEELIYVRFKLKEVEGRYGTNQINIYRNDTCFKTLGAITEFHYCNHGRNYYWYYEGFITIFLGDKITFRLLSNYDAGIPLDNELDKEVSYLHIQRSSSYNHL